LSRSARLFALLQALRCRRYAVTAAALARELQVSERTIYRDLSELAAQGAPVQGEAGVGYVLRPGLFLPTLMLTEDETEAVLLGLRYVGRIKRRIESGAFFGASLSGSYSFGLPHARSITMPQQTLRTRSSSASSARRTISLAA
jgi:predicted DNA-binding transcriptional regulator YafY